MFYALLAAKVMTYAFLIPVTALVVVGIIMLVSLCCRGGRFKKVVWWQYRFFLLFFSFRFGRFRVCGQCKRVCLACVDIAMYCCRIPL